MHSILSITFKLVLPSDIIFWRHSGHTTSSSHLKYSSSASTLRVLLLSQNSVSGRRYSFITEDRLLLIRLDVFSDTLPLGISTYKIRTNIYSINFIVCTEVNLKLRTFYVIYKVLLRYMYILTVILFYILRAASCSFQIKVHIHGNKVRYMDNEHGNHE